MKGKVGHVTLVTVSDLDPASAHLWDLCLGSPDQQDHGVGGTRTRREFFGAADLAWGHAAALLPRAVPMLWHDLEAIQGAPRHAELVDRRSFAQPVPTVPLAPSVIDGDSVGLAFLLSMASSLLGKPVPADWIASAALDADGITARVGGLESKIRMIKACAPQCKRLLVAAAQVDEARKRALEPASEPAPEMANELEIVGVKSASHALQLVFGDAAFNDRLISMVSTGGPAATGSLVDFFFRTSLGGRSSYVEWGPLARGADLLCDEAPGLDALEKWKLTFAAGVAHRHGGQRVPLQVPAPEILAAMPVPLRLEILAQLVQHSADNGTPGRDEVEQLIEEPLSLEDKDSFTEHLKLRGAYARLLAVCGEWRQALGEQRRVAHAFLDRMDYGSVSFQLSEWYRLIGVLCRMEPDFSGHEASTLFAEAEQARGLATMRAGFDPQAATYVQLARTRCELEMRDARRNLPQPDEIQGQLESLRELSEENAFAPQHVRESARRWALAVTPADSPPQWLGPIETAFTKGYAFGALADLDQALRTGDPSSAADALDTVRLRDPELVDQLMAAGHVTNMTDTDDATGPDGATGAPSESQPSRIATLYPY